MGLHVWSAKHKLTHNSYFCPTTWCEFLLAVILSKPHPGIQNLVLLGDLFPVANASFISIAVSKSTTNLYSYIQSPTNTYIVQFQHLLNSLSPTAKSHLHIWINISRLARKLLPSSHFYSLQKNGSWEQNIFKRLLSFVFLDVDSLTQYNLFLMHAFP